MRDDAISVSLELEGFRVTETIESLGAVVVVIETTVPAGVCPRCGHENLKGKPAWLRWRRRAFRCRGCAHRFLERHPHIPPRVRATPRFERYLYRRSRPGMVSLSYVARTRASRSTGPAGPHAGGGR